MLNKYWKKNIVFFIYFDLLDMLSHNLSPMTDKVKPLFLTGRGSGVLSQVSRLNLFINSTNAILASIKANLR